MKKLFSGLILLVLFTALIVSAPVFGEEAVKAGDIVYFGSYYYDSNSQQAPLEWIVLEVRDGTALLLSRYIIDNVQIYQFAYENKVDTTPITKWFSGFYETAFSPEEQLAILEDNGSNVRFLTNQEFETYLTPQMSKCAATPYAGAVTEWWTNDCKSSSAWISSSSGADHLTGSYVDIFGMLRETKLLTDVTVHTSSSSRNVTERSGSGRNARTTNYKITTTTTYVNAKFLAKGARPVIRVDLNGEKEKNAKYLLAQEYMSRGEYMDAVQAFEELGDYSDSVRQAAAAREAAEDLYQQAQTVLKAGDYCEAFEMLSRLRGFRDVDELLTDEDMLAEVRRTPFRTVGSYVTFGSCEQDNDMTNGTEPIEWLVLDVQDGKALLISRYGLDAKAYNTTDTSITWEGCTLRSWLNGEFLNAAFSGEEQSAILLTNVDNSASQCCSRWSTNGGNNTQDKIFLLSYAEANKYFGVQYYSITGAKNNMESRVSPTAYAKAQGAYTNSDNKTAEGVASGWWWLRSPGLSQYYAAHVSYDGSLVNSLVCYDSACVRPALWIDLDSGIF